MKNVILFSALLVLFVSSAMSQKDQPQPAAATKVSAASDIAKATLAAHGGEKLNKVKTLVMKGSVEMNVFNQTMPGAFSTAFSGNKYFFEITSAVQSIKQVSDGERTHSSIQGFMLPPVTSIGFPVLTHIGETGYVVSAIDETKKKRRGFRVTTPDGFYTDFLVDEKTNQLKGYESAFEYGERVITTSAAIDELQTVDGITVPKKYSQRFDLGTITAYATFKTKEILVNPEMDANAFAIPK